MAIQLANSQPCSSFLLSSELRNALIPLASPVSAMRNDVVVRQGAPCRGVYILQDGMARLSILTSDGTETFKRVLGPGCIIGLPAVLCAQAYSFTAHCQSDCKFQFVGAVEFTEFMRTQPVLGMEIVRLMGQELTEMNQRRTSFQKCRDCGCSFADMCEHEMGGAHS